MKLQGIKLKLSSLIILIILVIGIIAFVSLINIRETIITMQEASTRDVLADKSNIVIELFDSIKKDLDSLGPSADIHNAFNEIKTYHDKLDNIDNKSLNVESDEYTDIWDKHSYFFKEHVKIEGYYDMFLICAKHGHIMYSVEKEADLGANLKYGQYKDSSLAKLWAEVVSKKAYSIVDTSPYEASGGDPALFAGIPLLDENGEVFGVLAVQVSNEHIDDLLHYQGSLGDSVSMYLIGTDHDGETSLRNNRKKPIGDGQYKSVDILTKKTDHIITQVMNSTDDSITINEKTGSTGIVEIVGGRTIKIGDFNWGIFLTIYKKELLQPFTNLFLSIVGITVIIIILSSIFLFTFATKFTKPINSLSSCIQLMGKGDFTVRVDEKIRKKKDEIGDISNVLVLMLANIKNMVSVVKSSSENLTNTGQSLATAAEESSSALHEITANINNINERSKTLDSEVTETTGLSHEVANLIGSVTEKVTVQSAAITQSSSAIEEMDASIKNVNATSRSKLSIVNNLQKVASDGEKEMLTTIDNIKQMTQSASVIMELLAVINNIADQTNLLAMNAAIEAAHAGDAGKGFSVVADEIRKLAENTGDNAKKVSGSLDSVMKLIKESGSTADRTGNYFREIVEEIKDVSGAMLEISESMNELEMGSSQISDSLTELVDTSVDLNETTDKMAEKVSTITTVINDVAAISSETTSGMGEVSIGVNEIFKAVDDIRDLGSQNVEAIDKINILLDDFKV